MRAAWEKCRHERRPHRTRLPRPARDGTYRWHFWRALPIRRPLWPCHPLASERQPISTTANAPRKRRKFLADARRFSPRR